MEKNEKPRTMKVAVLGLSIDLGLLADYRFHPKLDLRHCMLLLRIFNAVVLTLFAFLYLRLRYLTSPRVANRLVQESARRRFSFLTSQQNFYQHREGYVAKLTRKYGIEVELVNQSAISNTLSRAVRHLDELASDQDLFFVHLGGMDFLQDVPVLSAARSLRLVLEEIGQRNPSAYVVVIGIPDFVCALASPCNLRKILDTRFSPTVGWMQRILGFSSRRKLWHGTADRRIEVARESLHDYDRMIRRELQACLKNGTIHDGCFIEQLKLDMFHQDLEQRKRLFSFDGIHLSADGVARLVKHQWKQLEPALDRARLGSLLSKALRPGQPRPHAVSLASAGS